MVMIDEAQAFKVWWDAQDTTNQGLIVSHRWAAWNSWKARADLSPARVEGRRHVGECSSDSYARDVCDGMYADKCDEVNDLCEVLKAVLSLAGESAEIRSIIEEALKNYE
jgi:hypothetical protein